jgi:hypothetical protein
MDLSGGNMTFSVGQDGQPYHSHCHRQLFHPRKCCRVALLAAVLACAETPSGHVCVGIV